MPTYVALTDVKAELPTTPPLDANDVAYTASAWNAILTSLIAKQSAYIDDSVGNNYLFAYEESTQKFPNIDDTVPTPAVIEDVCLNLVLYRALGYYSGSYVNEENTKRKDVKGKAMNMLKDIRAGIVKISLAGTSLFSVGAGSYNQKSDEDDESIFNYTEMGVLNGEF